MAVESAPDPQPDETMDGLPTTPVSNSTLAHLAGATGIVGQLAAAYWFLLLPMLVVPSPAKYVFYLVWGVLLVAAIAWWRRHPRRSLLVPIVSVPVALVALELGQRSLGWAP